MRNPYKPYQHTDGLWYVGNGKKFFSFYGGHDTEKAALIQCHKAHGHDCQEAIDKVGSWLEANDPDHNPMDPNGWLA